MTKLKKIILAMPLALSLAACGGGDESSNWYRDLRTGGWQWSGGNAQTMDGVIAKLTKMHAESGKKYDLAVENYAPGNWQYEWDQIGRKASANSNYLEAVIYHTVAAYPFVNENELSVKSYAQAVENYEKAVPNRGFKLEKISLDTQDGPATAYLHLPAIMPAERMPIMVVTNGSDHAFTQAFSTYENTYSKAGYAMISFDLPGLGINGHLTQHADRTNVIHQQVLKYIKTDVRLNSDKVVLLAKSFGGNAAVRTAYTNPSDVAAVVNWCGAVNSPFLDLDHTVEVIEKMTLDALKSRFDTDKAGLVALDKDLALSTHYLGKQKTSVPMLAVNHTRDHVFPVEDMRLVAKSSEQGEMIIIDESVNQGHCSSEENTLPEIVNWLDKTLAKS